MKRILLHLGLFLVLISAFFPARIQALSPYTTWTIGPGGLLYPTQDAYIPVDEIDLPLSAPEELFLAPDGFLYVADTGNGRIVKLDDDFQIAAEFGQGLLQTPTGLYIDQDGIFYIADAGKNTIVILNQDGSLRAEFGHPAEPLFGKRRKFLPRKLIVDARKNLYIVSEGSVDGLVMMNTAGNFIGYFGANQAQMSLKMILQRMFLTKEQLDQFIKTEAASPSNLTIDQRSLIYTVTAGTNRSHSIRKFNIQGINLLSNVVGSSKFRDIHVSSDGLMAGVDADGKIYEYTANGNFLFVFGALEEGGQRLGTLSNPVSIERSGNILYILDKDKNAIVTYRATDFAQKVHTGVRLYLEGAYLEAKPYFEEVLTYNGLFRMAYQGIADACYKQTDYRCALQAYRTAEDRSGYSEAFWERRNAVLQQYLGSAIVLFLALWVAYAAFTRLEKRFGWLEPARQTIRRLQNIRLFDDFLFLFRFIKQPADSFYYIKKNQRGSLTFALLLYFWVIVVRILSLYLTAFIFSPYPNPAWIPIETELVYALLAILLWNAANYLIATISDGEGRLHHVIIGTAYSLFPYALFALPIALFSNLLTLNEGFLYQFSMQLTWFWTGLMLFIMVKEIHNYSLSETIRNILLTLFTIAIFLLTGYILYVLFNQLYQFILAVIQEISLRG